MICRRFQARQKILEETVVGAKQFQHLVHLSVRLYARCNAVSSLSAYYPSEHLFNYDLIVILFHSCIHEHSKIEII